MCSEVQIFLPEVQSNRKDFLRVAFADIRHERKPEKGFLIVAGFCKQLSLRDYAVCIAFIVGNNLVVCLSHEPGQLLVRDLEIPECGIEGFLIAVAGSLKIQAAGIECSLSECIHNSHSKFHFIHKFIRRSRNHLFVNDIGIAG